MVHPTLILNLLKLGIAIELAIDGYIIKGFYKSGQVKLIPQDGGGYKVMARYESNHGVITCLDELVLIHFDWWLRSRDKWEGWKTPETVWAEEYFRLGLVKKTTTISVTYTENKDYA